MPEVTIIFPGDGHTHEGGMTWTFRAIADGEEGFITVDFNGSVTAEQAAGVAAGVLASDPGSLATTGDVAVTGSVDGGTATGVGSTSGHGAGSAAAGSGASSTNGGPIHAPWHFHINKFKTSKNDTNDPEPE